jgi:hypothetical protein
MFCPNCGARIIQDSRFCPECGVSPTGLTPQKLQETKQRNKLIVLVYIGLVALSLLTLILASIFKPTIRLNDYVKAEFSGFDGYGTATVSIDRVKFTEDYGKTLAKMYDMEEENAPIAVEMFCNSYIDFYMADTEKLSNGDVITCQWDCNDKAVLQKYGYKLKYKNITFTVENLTAPTTFDPFADITVKFEGMAPNGTARIERNKDASNEYNLNYSIDKDQNLNTGDTITVTCYTYNDDDLTRYMTQQYGLVPVATEKTYTVSGLSRYVSSLNDISGEALKSMQDVAENYHKDSFTAEGEALSSITYLGAYLLNDEKDEDYWFNNQLYLVYELGIQNDFSKDDETFSQLTKVYWYITYDNITVSDTGEITVDLQDYSTPRTRVSVDSGISTGWFSTKTWNYYGYSSVNELYESAIANAAEKYTLDSTVPTTAAQ